MKREHALAYLRIAGYHDDNAAFVRLYIENRVSYTAAKREFAAGKVMRSRGVRCTCRECAQGGAL